MQIKQVFFTEDGNQHPEAGDFNYCPVCGMQLGREFRAGKERPVCASCGFIQFRNPLPGVVVIIEKDGEVLLGKRRGGYGDGKWGLPQGYIEFEEDFLSAAIREAKEETGLDVSIRAIINVVSNFLSPRLHTLAIILLAEVNNGTPQAADDLATLEWFPISGPLPEMAFEADERIIRYYHQTKLQERLPVDKDFAG